MGFAAAAPIIAAGVGGLASSQGAKKAAKNAKSPDIPAIFKPAVGSALGLIGQRLARGFPTFPGNLFAPPTPLQGQSIDLAGGLLNDPRAAEGLQSAFSTVRGVSETGLDPASIEMIRKSLDPFFNFQREQGLAQTRESSALRGGFFGSGSQTNEADFLSRFAANQAATVLPLALQIRQLQLAAAQSLPGQLTASLQPAQAGFALGEQARGVEQAGINAQLAEFLRTQPENAIALLSSLMGGTPFYQPPIAPNFGQVFGAQVSNLAQSPGFLSLFQGGGARSSNPAFPAPTQPYGTGMGPAGQFPS